MIKEPTGKSPIANYVREIVREINANRIQGGVGYNISRTASGTILNIGEGGASGGSVEVTLCDPVTGATSVYKLRGTKVS